MLSKERRKEFAEERRMIRLEEAATAVADILERHNCDKQGWTMKCALLWTMVEDQAESNRHKPKFHYVPTVNNRVVPPPNESFARNNWRDIKLFAAEYGYYVVSRLPGDPHGVRLGTLEEYVYMQRIYEDFCNGMADTYNQRAETVESQTGEELPEMVVRIRQFIEEKEGG